MKVFGNTVLFFVLGSCLVLAQSGSSGYLKIGDAKIYYETAGTGPAVVFIHDGLVHSDVWNAQFSFFSENHFVVKYDRRGYGRSLAGTGHFSNTDDLHKLLNHLKIDRACLVALSSGGRLAIDFTLQHPEKVRSLVLVGAVVGGFPYTRHFFSRGGHQPSGLKTMKQRVAYYIYDDPYEIYKDNKEAKKQAARFLKKYPRKNLHPRVKKKKSRKGGKDGTTQVPDKPAYQRLNEINVPSLILVGEFDIPDVHAHAGVINGGIKNSRREIISQSGHLIPLEQPDRFNRAVKKFLVQLSQNQ
jgi:pimeloyl-ACP methyl ester carboxylesterase